MTDGQPGSESAASEADAPRRHMLGNKDPGTGNFGANGSALQDPSNSSNSGAAMASDAQVGNSPIASRLRHQ